MEEKDMTVSDGKETGTPVPPEEAKAPAAEKSPAEEKGPAAKEETEAPAAAAETGDVKETADAEDVKETEEISETGGEVPGASEAGKDGAGDGEKEKEDENGEEEPEPFNDEPPSGRKLGSLRLIYTEQDIYDVVKIQERSRRSLRVMTVLMMVLPILGVGMSVYGMATNPDASPANLVLWSLVLLFVLYSYFVAPKKSAARVFMQINEDQKAGDVSDFTVYEGGIYAESKAGKQTFLWNEFREVHECPAGIVIVTASRGPVFFPARLLKGFDRKRLSEVLEENFGRKYFVCDYKGAESREKPAESKAGENANRAEGAVAPEKSGGHETEKPEGE